MSYPEAYARQYDFQSYQNANPTRPLPGDKVNADLNAVEASIEEIIDFIEGFTRSDGALANGSVSLDTLDDALKAIIGDADALAALVAEIDGIPATVAAATAAAIASATLSATASAEAAALSAGSASTDASTASSSAAAAVAASAAVAFKYVWSASTSGDPGTGKIGVDNAAPGSATGLLISETDAAGNALASEIARWDDATNASGKSRIRIAKDATNFLLLTITSAVTDNGTYDSFTVSGAVLVGTIADGDTVYVQPTVNGSDGLGTGDASTNTATSVDGEMAVFSGSAGKTLRRSTLTGGLLKSTSGVPAIASAGTDYAPATSGSAILKGNGSGGFSSAAAGTDYVAATSGSAVQKANGSGGLTAATASDFVSPSATSTLTAGYTATSTSGGTITGSNQSYTPTPGTSVQNIQHLTLNGSSLTGTFTFSPPGSECSAVVEITNGGSGSVAATLSTSGFTKVTGDTYAGTNANKYLFYCLKSKNYSHLHIQALQ